MTQSRRTTLWRSLSPLCLAAAFVTPAGALELAWPDGALLVRQIPASAASHVFASAGFDGTGVPTFEAEGLLAEQVWQIEGDIGEPALVLSLLREQLTGQGYEILFSCAARSCGGFDFRFALPIAEGPEMHVDLGDFHYLAARRDHEDGASFVALTTSHGGRLGYAHLAVLAPPGAADIAVTGSTRTLEAEEAPEPAERDLAAQLLADGRVPLDDLVFQTGASSLSGRRYLSLVALAEFLIADPQRRIVLVGHTDAEGSLEANVTLSESRADAVRRFLVDELDVPTAQIEVEGIGFLAPRASNASAAGRQANRRVEVVLAAP